jgi:hypothetical protein
MDLPPGRPVGYFVKKWVIVRAAPWVMETRLIRALKGLNTMFSSGGTLFICH